MFIKSLMNYIWVIEKRAGMENNYYITVILYCNQNNCNAIMKNHCELNNFY